ncbi:LiaF transmembrane domain-containing protein [Tepidibacter sp. Z1-5]|uniref:LiaF transmembrane domain-containing protein n=1 Tax=Tepidibacter sp. Z1-5 TaxID=3134138 RepID=UPI0030C481E2
MNRGGVIWGIFFMVLGVGWTLENFNIIDVSTIDILVKFWPLILISIGVDIIYKNRKK